MGAIKISPSQGKSLLCSCILHNKGRNCCGQPAGEKHIIGSPGYIFYFFPEERKIYNLASSNCTSKSFLLMPSFVNRTVYIRLWRVFRVSQFLTRIES